MDSLQDLHKKLRPSVEYLNEFEEFEKKVDRVNELVSKIVTGENVDAEINAMCNSTEIQNLKHGNITSDVKNALLKENQVTISPGRKNIINNKPSTSNESLENLSSSSMPQEAFMKMVELDAAKRYNDRMERNKQSAELLKKGNEAFKNGNLEKALCCYNQAIDLRRDSSLLYTNRAVTHLKLGLLSKACLDCEFALKLKDSLKPRLCKGKALYEMGDIEESAIWIQETREKYPKDLTTIDEYTAEWMK